MYRNSELLRELLAESIPSLFAAVYSGKQSEAAAHAGVK
jgi:hypothetical protein